MEKHVTAEKEETVLKTISTTMNNKEDNPAPPGENPGKEIPPRPEEQPEKPVPETEKPDIHEMPKTRDNPEVEKTDIDEMPDTTIQDVPGNDIQEMPDMTP